MIKYLKKIDFGENQLFFPAQVNGITRTDYPREADINY